MCVIGCHKIALVTGANSGLGKAAALELAKRKIQVLIVCRNKNGGLKTLQEIQTESGNPHVSLYIADLSCQKSIHQLADQVCREWSKLDILIHAAGVLQPERTLSPDGLEITFATNHLAPFLLTQKLLPLLKSAPSARILTFTSRAEELGNIDFDDLQMKINYGAIRSYSQSKLANILFTYELARKLEKTKITANCIHPGLVDTNLSRHLPAILRPVIWVLRPFMSSPTKAIQTTIRLALDPQYENVTGKYFICDSEGKSSARSHDPILAQRLWKICEELTKLNQ